MKNVRVFASQVRESRGAYPVEFHPCRAWWWYPLWRYTLNRKDGLSVGRPWITFASAAFLKRVLRPHMRVLEWGSGGSTVFFASRVQSLETVEHEADWYQHVASTLQARNLTNVNLHCIGPAALPPGEVRSKERPEDYYTGNRQYLSCEFRAYASMADRFPDASFDLVSIDGRSRPACFQHGWTKVKPGGFLMLDDAQRAHYASIHEAMAQRRWTRIPFYGPGPYGGAFRFTCLWQRPLSAGA